MNSGIENQRVRLRVSLKKIIMNIKFPCSLTLQVKHDTSTDSRKLFELKNGECPISETIESELDICFNSAKQRYQDKKVSINVFMVSMSGKVASGNVSFSLFGKEPGTPNDCVQFLQKCPDKQAKIFYTFTFEILKRSEKLDKSFHSQVDEGSRKRTPYNSIHIPKVTTPRNLDKELYKPNRSPSPQMPMHESIVDGFSTLDREKKGTHRKEELEEKYRKPLRVHTDVRSKSKKLINQSVSYRAFQVPNFTPERFKTQTAEDQDRDDQLQKLRLKVRTLEQQDKGNSQIIREAKEEAERRRNKIHQLQNVKFELEEAQRTKDSKIKKLQKMLKDISEEKQLLDNQHKSLKTQAELRETTSREQLKKMEEKYRQSELEREHIAEEYNRALKTFEEGEKKYQLLIKDKERSALEDKGRMQKKIDQQSSSCHQLEKENNELKALLEEITREKKQLQQACLNSETLVTDSKSREETLTARLRAEGDKVSQLQQEIEAFKASQLEKQQIKKKLNESSISSNALSEKVQKAQKNAEGLEARVRELEGEVQKRNTERSQVNAKLNQLRKSHEELKLREEHRVKENQNLTSINATANSKISDLKFKLDSEKRAQEEAQRQFSSKYNWAIREKESSQAEVEQLRWELERQAGSLQDMSLQLRVQNQEIFSLNQDILESNEKLKKAEEVHRQLSSSFDHLTATNADNQTRKREYQSQLKSSQAENGQLRKKSERLEQEIADLRERVRAVEGSSRDRAAEAQKKLKEKEETIHAKSLHLQSLEGQLREGQDELSHGKQSLTSTLQELSHTRELLSNCQRELKNQEVSLAKLKEADSENKQLLAEKEASILKRQQELQKMVRSTEKLKEEAAIYQQLCSQTLQSYFQDLLKEQLKPSGHSQPLLNRNAMYPEEAVASLQVDYLQKHHSHSSKQRNLIFQLGQEKQVLQYELRRMRVSLEQANQKIEADVKYERQRIRALQDKLTKREELEREKVQNWEEQLSLREREMEQLKSDRTKQHEESSELRLQVESIMKQYESLKEENRQLEDRLLSNRSQQIRERVEREGKIHHSTSLYEEQLLHLQATLKDHELRASHLEKDLADRGQLAKKYEAELNVLAFERDAKEVKIQQISRKFQEQEQSFKEHEASYRQTERELRKASEAVEQLGARLREEREKGQELQFKAQEQGHIILDLNKEVQRWREEARSFEERLQEQDSLSKHRADALRALNQKQSSELKEAKEASISLSSELQLSKFMLLQQQHSNKAQKEAQEDLKQELERKKQQLHALTDENSLLQTSLRSTQDQLASALDDNQALTAATDRLKQNIIQIRDSFQEDHIQSERLAQMERDLQSQKNQKDQLQQLYDKTVSQLKGSLRQAKRQEGLRLHREEDLKKKLKSAQRLLENSHPDLAAERSRILKETDRQKRDISTRNQNLEAKVGQLEEELSSLRQRMRREGDRALHQNQSIKEDISTKDFIIRNQQIEMDSLSYKLSEVAAEKTRLDSKLEEERARSKKAENQLLDQRRASKEELKQQEEGLKGVLGDIAKRLQSSRQRKLEGGLGQVEKMLLGSTYRELQDIVESAARERRGW